MTLNRGNYKFIPLEFSNRIQRTSVEEEKDFALDIHKTPVIHKWDTAIEKMNSVTIFIMQSIFNRG